MPSGYPGLGLHLAPQGGSIVILQRPHCGQIRLNTCLRRSLANRLQRQALHAGCLPTPFPVLNCTGKATAPLTAYSHNFIFQVIYSAARLSRRSISRAARRGRHTRKSPSHRRAITARRGCPPRRERLLLAGTAGLAPRRALKPRRRAPHTVMRCAPAASETR